MGRNTAHTLLICVAGLIGLGLVMLASVGPFSPDNRGQPLYFLQRQGLWLVAGIGVCVVLARLDPKILITRGLWILVGATLLVLLCHVPGLGKTVKGSARWIPLGPFALQPGEFLKLATVIFAAGWVHQQKERMRSPWYGLLLPMLILGLPILLLLKQPDLGSAMFVVVAASVVLFAGGAPLLPLAIMGILAVVGVIALALTMPERMGRLVAFMDPEAHRQGGGYQVWQALVALGSGGTRGVGLGQSVQKMFYLPEAHTDFIFPILGEELGLPFTLGVVAVFLVITLLGGYIACHAPDLTAMTLGIGLTALVAMQAVANLAVVTGLLPPKGVGLPFISYGGSNLVLCLAAVGMLVALHRQAHYREEARSRRLVGGRK
ncbi:MAG: putative lipid II flippase FtsW [Verrucomicrobia bacterium]|jgi:cell division protein FtsW|nr:putative lipid II flippase FtsW [Verrucomicrobiota bacterium]NBS83387.1 putative lipid II flippase FtsW [Verrucomicrobiota bacterium]